MNFETLMNMDFVSLLQKMNAEIAEVAAKLGLYSWVLFAASAVLALIVGVAGMHLAKVLSSFATAGLAFLAGASLFSYMKVDLAWGFMAKIPDYFAYILGLILAIIVFILAWKKCLHVVFAGFTVLGYVLVSFYLPEKMLIAAIGGLILGTVALCVVRFAFVALSSVIGGSLLTSFVGAILPSVGFLQFGNGIWALVIAGALSLIFFILQMVTTRNYYLED